MSLNLKSNGYWKAKIVVDDICDGFDHKAEGCKTGRRCQKCAESDHVAENCKSEVLVCAEKEAVTLFDGTNTLEDSYDVADFLNNYFVNLPILCKEKLVRTNWIASPTIGSLEKSVFIEPVTETTVYNIINGMKSSNSVGMDDLSANTIKTRKIYIGMDVTVDTSAGVAQASVLELLLWNNLCDGPVLGHDQDIDEELQARSGS
ncbi:hypothetical protein QE152_g24262 [Popillia japonica]|uniref:Polyprotein n=1 Tax=Popillia japonica TaxID=7064 RepID=A0AAW1KFK2_POPJA